MIWRVFLRIVFSLLILSGFEYSRIFAQMNRIHDSTSEGILSQVTVNAENVFSGVRESSGTALPKGRYMVVTHALVLRRIEDDTSLALLTATPIKAKSLQGFSKKIAIQTIGNKSFACNSYFFIQNADLERLRRYKGC